MHCECAPSADQRYKDTTQRRAKKDVPPGPISTRRSACTKMSQQDESPFRMDIMYWFRASCAWAAAALFSLSGVAEAQSVRILEPFDKVNLTSIVPLLFDCVAGFNQAEVTLNDSNGVLMEDTGWISVFSSSPPAQCSANFQGLAHPIPWDQSPLTPVLKGLLVGEYTVQLRLRDTAGQTIDTAKSFSVVPNADIKFQSGKYPNKQTLFGDWDTMSASSFGARGVTPTGRALTVISEPPYVRPIPGFTPWYV